MAKQTNPNPKQTIKLSLEEISQVLKAKQKFLELYRYPTRIEGVLDKLHKKYMPCFKKHTEALTEHNDAVADSNHEFCLKDPVTKGFQYRKFTNAKGEIEEELDFDYNGRKATIEKIAGLNKKWAKKSAELMAEEFEVETHFVDLKEFPVGIPYSLFFAFEGILYPEGTDYPTQETKAEAKQNGELKKEDITEKV